MYRNFLNTYRETIPAGLPSRLVDPMLRTIGEQPQFLKIGEGNNPRNELLRKVYQQPSKDVVRTKVLKNILAVNPTDKYDVFSKPNNAYALIRASEDLGIPLESIGFSVDPNSNAFRLKGSLYTDSTAIDNARTLVGRVASTQAKAGNPYIYNQLQREQEFFAQPTSHSEIAVDGSEGVEAIYEAYKKAEPDVNGSSQGLRPILNQAGGLDANIGIRAGSPENIPPMDIEGMKGANRYVDVSQGLETARVIQYPGTNERLGLLAQQKGLRLQGEGVTSLEDLIRADKANGIGVTPVVTATIPYAADIPTAVGDSILSPKVSIETKRPRFIDLGTGIYTRSGEPINADQKNLLDMGMADLEDRSFILKDPIDLARQPARALASRLPTNYYGAERDIPTGVDAVIRGWGRKNEQGYLQTDLPLNYYGVPRVIPTAKFAEGGMVTPTSYDLPLTDEIGSVIGSQINREQYRPTTRLGLQTLGLNADIGRQTITPSVEIGDTLYPSNTTTVRRSIPITHLTDDLSNRVLAGDVDLRNYEPFRSVNTPQYYLDQSKEFVGPIRAVKDTTYGASKGKTPWREYYSDPFVYEDKGLDSEANKLMRAINEAPAQLESALSNQAVANRKAMELETAIQSFRRIAKGGKKADISMSPEMMVELAEVAPRIREWKTQRRGNEIMAAKAQDKIAELKAAQELLDAEYMVKPKRWGEDVLSGYRKASATIGGVRDSNEVPTNDRFSEEVLDKLVVSKDPSLVRHKTARRIAKPNGWDIKPNAVQMWREALQQEALDNRRDYDIASAFGFTGNY